MRIFCYITLKKVFSFFTKLTSYTSNLNGQFINLIKFFDWLIDFNPF